MSDQARIQPGDVLANPVTGERFTFIETAASSNGALLAFELDLREGGRAPIAHVHPIQTERFHVLDGTVRFRVGRRSFPAERGQVVEVRPGVIHGFANPGPGPARMRVDVTPALQMEQMLADVVTLAKAGRLTRRGLPRNPLQLARLARAYDNVAHAPHLSIRLQRLLLSPLTLADRRPRRAPGTPQQSLRSGSAHDHRPLSEGVVCYGNFIAAVAVHEGRTKWRGEGFSETR
jgi:quercetin dioxygenase-like cupin family protein